MAEQIQNFGKTTINEAGGISASATSWDVTDGSVFPSSGDFRINVDDEIMKVTARATNTLTVERGAEGTTATTHDDGAEVRMVLTAGALTAAVEQLANGWFNVVAYGATGDGSTDDTSAINSAIAAMNTAGAGVLYFPAGTYVTTGALTTITATCRVVGDGATDYDESSPGSKITCSSSTAVLFDVTSERVTFESLALMNTSVSTPTAGSGIYSHGASLTSRTDYIDLHVQGFYDNIDQAVGGALWVMTRCMNKGPVRYGVRIRNTVNADAGDWAISDCGFYSADQNATAAIRLESSGGGKIVNCKFNADPDLFKWTYDIDLAGSATTSILLVSNCSFENYGNTGYHADGAWKYQVIVGCEFGQYNGGTGNAISIANTSYVLVDDCAFVTTESSKTAISLTSVTQSSIGHLVNDGFATLVSGTPTYDHTGGIGSRVFVTGVPTTGQVPTATSGTAATWQTPSSSPPSGHYETLMTGSSPPSEIEDGTGEDWLWVWVND